MFIDELQGDEGTLDYVIQEKEDDRKGDKRPLFLFPFEACRSPYIVILVDDIFYVYPSTFPALHVCISVLSIYPNVPA